METDLVGKVLGPCRLEGVLGSGGMGVVYRGRHIALDRPVAVKVIRGEGAVLDRWLAEARAAASVEDDRVVRIFDAAREGELCYVVMQLIEGRSLAETVDEQGPMPIDRACAVVAQLALGLSAVHRRGVVHRDVKPSNVMLAADGAVLLVDFGVAATAGQERGAAGSFGFMAPEQSQGAQADPRQDLYGLGGCLWFCLTGRAPVPDWTPVAPALKAELPALTPYAAQLIASLLDADPGRRPSDAGVVAASLRAREMVLAVAPSGSPMDLLEPPPVPAAPAPREAPPPRAVETPNFPDPPPPLPAEQRFSPAAGVLLLAALGAAFGPAWRRVGPADWLGAGAFAALALMALSFSDEPEGRRRLAAAGLLAAMAAALSRSGGSWAAPAALEGWAAAGLGLTLAAAGALAAFWASRRDRWLGGVLLLAAALLLPLAAAGRDLPAGPAWLSAAAAALVAEARALRDTGGLLRWSGPVALYAIWRIKKASC